MRKSLAGMRGFFVSRHYCSYDQQLLMLFAVVIILSAVRLLYLRVMPITVIRAIWYLLLGIIPGQKGYTQGYSNDSLFQKFKSDIETEQDSHNSRVVWDEETRETYYLLLSHCPIEALVKHTNDSNPAVRSKIFVGLAQKGADAHLLQEILDRHNLDTAEFIASPTDVVMTWTVRGYMQTVLDAKKRNDLPQIDFGTLYEQSRSRPRVIIPGARHDIICKDSLLKIDSLAYSVKGFTIASFKTTIRNTTIETNNIFTQPIRALINELESGERVFIEDLRVVCPDKTLRRLNDIILRVK